MVPANFEKHKRGSLRRSLCGAHQFWTNINCISVSDAACVDKLYLTVVSFPASIAVE